MPVFRHKPTPKKLRHCQVIRRMGLIALTAGLKYAVWTLLLLVIVMGCLLTGAVLVGCVIALLMAGALFWVPWPTDWLLQLMTVAGLVLYALGFVHLIYKLYRHAVRIERNQTEYIG